MAAPRGLKAAGRKLWRDVTGKFELDVDEERLLEQACRELDLIARLDAAIDGDEFELTVEGSMGQQVTNPLLTEVRQHRNTFASLVGKLSLPSEDGAASASSSARALAQKRWKRGA